jgi:hypothetical protein
MKNSVIVLSANPKGVEIEGTLGGNFTAGAPVLPGTHMQIALGVAADASGRMTWIPYDANANGDPRLTAILTEDFEQGFNYSNGYITGQRIFLYVPLGGEELNILLAGAAGTGSANAFTVGERIQPSTPNGTGVVQNTSANPATFIVMEHIDEVPDVATLCWCIRQ